MYEFFQQNQRQMRYAAGPDCSNGAANNHKKVALEKGSNIAQKAAQEAKAASEAQNIAGQQASHQVLVPFFTYCVACDYENAGNACVTRKLNRISKLIIRLIDYSTLRVSKPLF